MLKRFFFKAFLLLICVSTLYVWLGGHVHSALVLLNQDYKLKMIRRGENRPTIILGDSRALAMNQFGAPGVYNYATTYFYGMYPYVYLLRYYLQYNEPPKVILLSIIPETFCERQDYTVSPSSARLFTLHELFTNPNLRAHPKKLMDMLWTRYNINRFYANRFDPTLFNPDTGFAIFSRSFNYRKVLIAIPDDTFRLSPVTVSYFKEFVELARENNIKVVLYFMPVSEPAFHFPDFYPAFQRTIRKVVAPYPWVKLIPPYPPEDAYPESYTVDGTHLNERGAEHFNRTRFPSLLEACRLFAQTP